MYKMNVNKLNGKIVEKAMTKDSLASAMGVDRSTFFRRLKNGRLLLADVYKIAEVMELTRDEVDEIFFN